MIGANVFVTLQLFVKIEVSRFSQSKYRPRLERRSQNLKIRPLGPDLLSILLFIIIIIVVVILFAQKQYSMPIKCNSSIKTMSKIH